MKIIVPNAITAINIVCGVLSLMFIFEQHYQLAAVMIILAMIADAMDGRVARVLKVNSEFGKELDSLCDLVSFGVVPAILGWQAVLNGRGGYLSIVIVVVFALCGALRLARFNINTNVVKGYFVGMPIPTAGCLVATFVLAGLKCSDTLFMLFMLITALLMVSKVHYPDFKAEGDPNRVLAILLTIILIIALLIERWQAVIFAPFAAFTMYGILNSIVNVIKPINKE